MSDATVRGRFLRLSLCWASGKAPVSSYTCVTSRLSQAIYIVNHHKGSGG